MLRNNRFYVLLFSFVFSIGAYLWVHQAFRAESVQLIRLSQIYALSAVFLLYITLLAGPLSHSFPNLPFAKQYLHARRGLGVAAFYFGSLHAYFSFFKLLGGFEGIGFLSDQYILNTFLGFAALCILFLLAITSFDVVIHKMTFAKWKILQRFVYVAAVFILIHALLLGTHFQTLSEFIPQIFFSALFVLLFLEARRFDAYLSKQFNALPQFGISGAIVFGVIIAFYTSSLVSPNGASPISTHSQMQMGGASVSNDMTKMMAKYPGMDGDTTKRFTTGFIHDKTVMPLQDATLRFPVYDANSGQKIAYFKTLYEKPAHLIIVDSSLLYYHHIHPQPTDNGFTVTTQFPKNGEYHLYINFQPFGGIEQQMAFTLLVGAGGEITKPQAIPDTDLTKTFGDYQVTLDYEKPLEAKKLSVGQQSLNFTVKDKNGKDVTTLKPYLASFGHLVMINKDTYDYLHVHPKTLTAPKPDENGGPTVSFLPFGMYGAIKPGVYRIFGQFNPDGKLFTADFTVTVNE